MKKSVWAILKISISLFFIALLLWLMRESIGRILVVLRTTKIWLFCLGVLLCLVNVVIISYRLKRVLTVQDIHLPLKNVTALNLIGLFFTSFMPTAVGGDVVKAHYTAKSTHKKLESFTSVFVDRVLGFFSFIALATFALIFYGRNIEDKVVIWTVVFMLIVSLFALIILLNRNVARRLRFILTTLRFVKLDTKLRKVYEAIASYRDHWRIVIHALYISLICQVLSIFTIYILAKSISVNVPLMVLFLVIPIIATLGMLPSINGLGIREGAYVYFLGGIVGHEQAFAISLLWLGLLLAISLLGGLVYLFRGHRLGLLR